MSFQKSFCRSLSDALVSSDINVREDCAPDFISIVILVFVLSLFGKKTGLGAHFGFVTIGIIIKAILKLLHPTFGNDPFVQLVITIASVCAPYTRPDDVRLNATLSVITAFCIVGWLSHEHSAISFVRDFVVKHIVK